MSFTNKLVVGAALAMAVSGCADTNATQTSISATDYNADQTGYDVDSRTGLCFAFSKYQRQDTASRYSEGISMASVPCTPKVLALVKAEKKQHAIPVPQ